MKVQRADNIVRLADWALDEEFPVHPFGAREKQVFVCPSDAPDKFLVPDHRYIFKLSNPRAPAQFWSEVIAYRVGCLMGVPVPPAFVAMRGDGAPGALIEFFFEYPETPSGGMFVHGGDYCQGYLPGYDRKKGSNHSVRLLLDVAAVEKRNGLEDDVIEVWSRYFLFDALIGNTDRHHDNWGIVWRRDKTSRAVRGTFAPAFDNGTSLGNELLEKRLRVMCEPDRLSQYVSRGTHHIRWQSDDPKQLGHMELIRLLLSESPHVKQTMRGCLEFEWGDLERFIRELEAFDVPVPFSYNRSQFVLSLLKFRYDSLISLVGT